MSLGSLQGKTRKPHGGGGVHAFASHSQGLPRRLPCVELAVTSHAPAQVPSSLHFSPLLPVTWFSATETVKLESRLMHCECNCCILLKRIVSISL